jgi:hypothetical protein
MKRITALPLAAACGLSLALCAAPPPASAQQYAAPTVVMSGLFNPHGLTFGPDGGLYVAEAGAGGSGPSIVSGDGSTVSYGLTGGISRLLNGVQTQVVAGIPSLAAPGGASATGLADLAFDGSGNLYGLMGFGTDPAKRATLTAGGASGGAFGQLVKFGLTDGTRQNVADVSAFESGNPDGTDVNSNPYSLTFGPGGTVVVADAGANDLLSVDPTNGNVSLLTVFPTTTFQPVPDSIVLGPDGNYYVGQLTGGPFPPGAANVWRVDPTTGTVTVAASGFTNIADIAFSPDGTLDVLEVSEGGLAAPGGPVPGALFSVDLTSGTKTLIADQGLVFPTGLTVGSDGSLYVVNQGTSPGGGQVLRFAPVPEPSQVAALGLGVLGLAGLTLKARKRNGMPA